MLVDLASDSSLVDWVMKCEKPISWWLMNAHSGEEKFITYLPSQHFFPSVRCLVGCPGKALP